MTITDMIADEISKYIGTNVSYWTNSTIEDSIKNRCGISGVMLCLYLGYYVFAVLLDGINNNPCDECKQIKEGRHVYHFNGEKMVVQCGDCFQEYQNKYNVRIIFDRNNTRIINIKPSK